MDTADPTPEKETDTKTGELAQIPEETKRKKKHHHHKKEESSCSSEEKSEEEKTKPKEKIVIKDLIAENFVMLTLIGKGCNAGRFIKDK